jgi:tetratricopeptide (TPR) repeat protein
VKISFVKAIFTVCLILLAQNAGAVPSNIDKEISKIRYRVTAIEHESDDKIVAFDNLIIDADKLVSEYPDMAEPYVWKAIALSAKAKHQGISALSSVKQAKKLLEKSIGINPSAADGAGYNALAMLYYKVPGWPIGFGDSDKAEEYFQKALSTSSNLDTNYRYGEFLIEDVGNKEKGLKYLNKALDFADRKGRKEDALKKDEVRVLINKIKK